MSAALTEAYAASVRYIFSNADFSSAGRRYQNPLENWKRFDTLGWNAPYEFSASDLAAEVRAPERVQ